jgi:transaldolase
MRPEVAFQDTEEPARHLSAIQSLSAKHHIPVDIIAELYTSEWALLRKNARLTDYLSVFVSRRVSERLNTLKSATTGSPNVRSLVQ